MTKTKWAISMLGVLIACSLSVSSVRAQQRQTFVSSTGNDANPCTRTAPCRMISAAVANTSPGGEVRVLDAVEDQGLITIDKSITIDGGNLAFIIVPHFTHAWSIVINADVSDVITIRNISIERSNNNGITFLNGKQLNVENVKIQGVPQRGIDINLPAGATAAITVKDTTIRGQSSGLGVRMFDASSTSTLIIDRSQIQGFASGLNVLSGKTTIINSVVSHNFNFGIIAEGGTVNVDTCLIWKNFVGLQAQPGATLRLARNGIYDNTTSIGNGGGTVASDGDNRNSNPNAGLPNGAITKQ